MKLALKRIIDHLPLINKHQGTLVYSGTAFLTGGHSIFFNECRYSPDSFSFYERFGTGQKASVRWTPVNHADVISIGFVFTAQAVEQGIRDLDSLIEYEVTSNK